MARAAYLANKKPARELLAAGVESLNEKDVNITRA